VNQAERYDVVVVGGGSAGLAAALAAAERGARTLLVERGPALGGNAAHALVHTFCGLYLSAEAGDAVPANPGLPQRFARALARAGGAAAPERAGRVWVLPTFPPALERFAARACDAQPGLDVHTRCAVVGAALVAGPHETSLLELARGAARERVTARIVIDATGDANLGALCGARLGEAPAERLQAPSFIFRVRGADTAALAGFGRLQISVAVAGAARRGALPPGCESVLVRPGADPGEAYVTLNLPRLEGRPYEPLDEDYLHALGARSRKWAEAVVALLREARPGFERCEIAAFPRRVGVRETRTVMGSVVLERDDVLAGRRRDDEVALSSWPIELWHDHTRAVFEHPVAACGVPLGALVSASHPNLGMAGRCLSATHEALGALRVIGTALATGEAIGVAAALAADTDLALAEVAPGRVRQEIDRLAGGSTLG
jgi:glycine/D-amino acid oxidase-like deaminating enzyme